MVRDRYADDVCCDNKDVPQMHRLIGYLRTLCQYTATAKGRHDILDYLYALVTFFVITALVLVILQFVR